METNPAPIDRSLDLGITVSKLESSVESYRATSSLPTFKRVPRRNSCGFWSLQDPDHARDSQMEERMVH